MILLPKTRNKWTELETGVTIFIIVSMWILLGFFLYLEITTRKGPLEDYMMAKPIKLSIHRDLTPEENGS